jgi:hypothetical protein
MIGCPANDLTDHGSLLIRRAVLRDDWIGEELLTLATAAYYPGKKEWDLKEWDTMLAELQSSTLTVAEWLTLYT